MEVRRLLKNNYAPIAINLTSLLAKYVSHAWKVNPLADVPMIWPFLVWAEPLVLSAVYVLVNPPSWK
jgi:hypothetical protein